VHGGLLGLVQVNFFGFAFYFKLYIYLYIKRINYKKVISIIHIISICLHIYGFLHTFYYNILGLPLR
jgi:hypothetical protein